MAKDEEISPLQGIITVIVVVIILFYVFIWQPIAAWWQATTKAMSDWWQANFPYIVIGVLVIFSIIFSIVGISHKRNKIIEAERRAREEIERKQREEERRIKEAQKKAFEEEQTKKGLVKFTYVSGEEKWGTPREVEKWEIEEEEELERQRKLKEKQEKELREFQEEQERRERIRREKESLFNRVVESINKFEPFRKYKNEFPYQVDLARLLKTKFPSVTIEQQKGSSRPDIVVNDIAIEVKGPTRRRDIDTLTSKINRYSNHYKKIIIVLFEFQVNDRYFKDTIDGFKRNFPNVKLEVIKK
jgi:flagellar biosynthesis GTPase FlhF